MKLLYRLRLSFILMFCVLLVSDLFCQNYEIETKLLDLTVKTYAKNGVNLNNEYAKFEKHLIDSGVITDNSFSSYVKLLDLFVSQDSIVSFPEYSLFDTINAHAPKQLTARQSFRLAKRINKILESDRQQESNIFDFYAIMDSIGEMKLMNIEIDGSFKTLLPADQFDHPFYKMSILVMISVFSKVDDYEGFSLSDFSVSEDVDLPKQRNVVVIYIGENDDSVLFNSVPLAISDLSEKIRQYIYNVENDTLLPELLPCNIELIGDCYQSQIFISLRNNRNAKYLTYVKVQEILMESFASVRNEMSLKYFDKKFKDLNEAEAGAIRKLVPIKISEAEPESEEYFQF